MYMTEQNNTKVIMNHNGTQSYQFHLIIFYSADMELLLSYELQKSKK
jgi:hypothetical protein